MDFVEANDVMLAYEVFEARGPRRVPPLILMRGLGTQMIQWHRPLIDSFTAQGMDVVIFDNRDVGRSTKLDAAGIPDFSALTAVASVGTMFPVPYTLDDMARDVVGLMDGLDMPRDAQGQFFRHFHGRHGGATSRLFLRQPVRTYYLRHVEFGRPGRAATR